VKRILSTFRRSERNNVFFLMWWMAVSCRTQRIATLSSSAKITGLQSRAFNTVATQNVVDVHTTQGLVIEFLKLGSAIKIQTSEKRI